MTLKKWTLTAISALILAGCAGNPTGRPQVTLFSAQEMNKLGAQSFSEMKQKEKVNIDVATNRYVQCVANTLISAMDSNNDPKQWEVVVFESDQVNAFALPGGKIGVYTGLLQVATDDGELAAVMGHEVAHVLAEHANERMSTNQLIQAGMQLGDLFLKRSNNQFQSEIMAGLGLGAQFGIAMPFGRSHESEADKIGVNLMAKAGFNPKSSVTLWQKMAQLGGQRTPEFFSTHPSPENRINQLREAMPEAMKYFNASKPSVCKKV